MGDADIPLSTFSQMAGDQSHPLAGKARDGEDQGNATTDLLASDSLRKAVDDILDHDPGNFKASRGKASRKKTRRQSQKEPEESGLGRKEVTGEQKVMFSGFVNLYVEYVLVKAMRVMVKDNVKRNTEVKGVKYGDVEAEPIFCATDESYVDIIDKELESTLTGGLTECQAAGNREANVDLVLTKFQRDDNLDEEMLDRLYISSSLSQSDIAGEFELAAEHFLNNSIPENSDDDIDGSHIGKLSPARCTIPDTSLIDDDDNSGQCRLRRTYEFEVDCETGMITSRETVSHAEYEVDEEDADYHECFTDVDVHQDRLTIEEVVDEGIDGNTRHSFVEFGPDVGSVFHVINDDDEDETIYTVPDENNVETKLARKISSFRARSPTKLPRAIREQTDGLRRRCFSTGDTDRYEFLDDSSNEFYTDPDVLDRIYTLPSPPRSHPNSGDHTESENEDERSSSQEELAEILDLQPPTAQPESLESSHVEETNNKEYQRMMMTEVTCEFTKACSPDADNIYEYQIASFNNNRRSSDHCRGEQIATALSSTDDSGSSIEEIQLPTDDRFDRRVPADVAEVLQRAQGTRESVIVPGDFGQVDDMMRDLNEQPADDENIFESIRRRHSHLRRREVNDLLTDLAREREALDRVVRDTERAKDEYLHLHVGVKTLLERLESLNDDGVEA